MERSTPVITLLTDFGLSDTFVGVMKGVILGIAPEAVLVDLTHDVPPGDIACGAYHLTIAWHRFPPGTIHVAVVDPGVGSSRRALAVEIGGHMFLAPDNGLLSGVLHDGPSWRAHAITDTRFLAHRPSATFHGRDLFAPAAARIAGGARIESLGPAVSDPVLLAWEPPRIEGRTIMARVAHVDRFGNVILDAGRREISRAGGEEREVGIAAEAAGVLVDRYVTHYAAAAGGLCVLLNSDDRVEIARPGGSASAELGLSRGDIVIVRVAPNAR